MKFYSELSSDLRYIMRITLSQIILAIIITGVSYAANSRAQGVLDNSVKINRSGASLSEILRYLERAADVKFVYSRNVIDVNQQATVLANNEKLAKVLDELLPPRGIDYEVIDDKIVLSRAKDVQVADITVTGTVTSADGETLPGVSVKLKGTSIGATTNVNGVYTIRIPDAQANGVLVFSYVGFDEQELPIGGRTSINIVMKENVRALEEVVVVGYNVVKKSDVTGAVVSVDDETIRSRPVANALQAIQGKAAGVDITSNERPGEVGRILIRGARSLTATNSPLYVVDGIPLSQDLGIESINPYDIEAIDILKDASATAIYGSRGANGVVLIRTKRGKSGALTLNYVGNTTIENNVDRTEMMNSAQFIEFRRAAKRRQGIYPEVATRAADSILFSLDPYVWRNVVRGWEGSSFDGSRVATTDWTGLVSQTGLTHDHLLSASGGTEKLKAYGSFGYLDQEGTQLGQDYTRYNSKFTADITPVKWFTFGGSINATYSVQNYGFSTVNATGPGSLYAAAQGMLPYAVPYDDNGNRINLPGADVNILNPVGEDAYNINERKVLRLMGSLYGEVSILKDLKYRVNFGPDYYHNRNGRWMGANSINRGGGEPGSTNFAQLNSTLRYNWTLDHLLYYNKTINKDHTLGVTLLETQSSFRDEFSNMEAQNLPWDSQRWYQLNSVSALQRFSSGLTERTLNSYMGRLNYDYKNKLILTASGRWDGASQLATGHKWDFFPSAALAYRLDQESWVKNTGVFDQLKVRLGVGSTGNAAVKPYSSKGAVDALYYTWGNTVDLGYVSSDASLADPNEMPNYELGWEHTTQWNLGLDFGILKGRVTGTLDLYTSRTKDVLMEAKIPSVTGYTSTFSNIGITANRGVDLSLNTINLKRDRFTWSSTLNLSANKDRIIELAQGKQDDIANGWFIGERLTSYYDYVKVGVWQNTAEDLELMEKFRTTGNHAFKPGDIRVADLNNDFVIDANNDRVILGHANPNLVVGLTNNFSYKNWDFSFFLYSRWKYTILSGAEFMEGRYAQRLIDYWTPNNPTNNYPSPNAGSASGDTYRTSMNYQDGSFIALRNIALAYTLPKKWLSTINLSSVRLYGQVINPGLLYSGIEWLNPDTGNSTYNRGFVFGVNVGF